MEGFLSLPRSAKGGLAVLLAVALLGWGIVAYSAKRQHDDARSLDDAIATLEGHEDRATRAVAELDSLKQRFAAVESELASSRETVTTVREEKRGLEAKLAEIETAAGRGDATALFDRPGDEGGREGADPAPSSTIERLRSRLDETMAALSAKTATLEQRERALAGLEEDAAAAEARIAELEAALAERGQAGGSLDAEDARLRDLQAQGSSLSAENDELQASLSDKEDAIAYARSELDRLQEELASLEQRIAEKESELAAKDSMLEARELDIQGAEASLAALKVDRAAAEAETVQLKTALNQQAKALDDLASLKGELDAAETELASQTALLEDRRAELAIADAKLAKVRQASTVGSDPEQTLPQIPIAALGQDDRAVLPVDPTQHPFPVQTDMGVRLTLVHFDLGSAELTPGGLRRAKEAAAWIKQQDVDKIRLVGATDTIGTRENNKALAERRARSLLDVFAAEGIDPDRIELISMGEEGGGEVIADQTAEPLNRCVGVFIGEG